MSDDLELEQIAKEISEGSRKRLGDLRLEKRNGVLAVTGWTNFTILENLTQAQALKELGEIRELYERIVHQCPQFLVMCGASKVKFILDFDDGGGAAGVCEEESGVVTWIAKLPRR